MPEKMQEGNCLIFALRMYRKHGGYVVIRKSLHGPIPHFLWLSAEDGDRLISFQPKWPKSGWLKFLHKLCFRGEIQTGDGSYKAKQKGVK